MKQFISLSLICIGVISGNVFGQISVNTAQTPQQLVNNVLVGQGVSVSNITFTGQSSQIGYFNAGTSNIGLPSGVVMSSGQVTDCVPPNQPSSSASQFGAPGDNDLLAVAQSVSSNPSASSISSTNDAAILEFDFVPVGDTVKFSFVFASEEYETYINTVYNDAFGFFVSGPGITGPYSSPAGFPNGSVNLASVPNSTTPITISTIYPGMNSSYYQNTPVGHSFNGFTIPIEIAFEVQCGQTYHFKFAVADCQDDFLDTGVFLEAGSFSSNSITVESNASYTNSFTDTLLTEDCVYNTLNFIRPHASDTVADTLPLIISGTVDVLADLTSQFTDTIFFPVGVDTVSLVVNPIDDMIAESTEYIEIGFYNITPCGDTIYDSIVLYIVDQYPLTYDLVDIITSACITQTDQVEVLNFDHSIPPYSVSWDFGSSNNPTDLPFLPSETDTVTYYVTIMDGCGDTWLDSVVHYVEPQILTFDLPDSVYSYCVGDTVPVEATNFANAPGPYSFNWSFGSSANPTDLPVQSTNNTSLYYLTVTDACNRTYLDSVYYNTNQTLAIDSLISQASSACDPTGWVSAFVNPANITGVAYNHWTGPDTSSNYIDASVWQNLSPGWYYFSITDDVCMVNDSVYVDVENPPIADLSASVTYGCSPLTVNFSNNSQNTNTYYWDFGNGNSYNVNDLSAQTETFLTGNTTVMLVAFADPTCSDTAYVTINVDPCGCTDPNAVNYNPTATIDDGSCIYPEPIVIVPNVFTPNGDNDNDLFLIDHKFVVEIELVIVNRWGDVMYEGTGTNPVWDGKDAVEGTYFYKYKATGYTGNEVTGHGFVELIRD